MKTSTVIDETISLTKEFYITSFPFGGGSGTKTDPYRAVAGNIDSFVSFLGDSCKVHLLAGNYTTKGFKVPKNFILLGAGKDSTFLKLVDNVGKGNFNYPHLRMLVDNGWSNLFIVKDITLDGNWTGQSEAETNGNFKIEPIVVQTIRGKVENVRVTNFGSNAKDYGNVGLECFPLCLLTFSNGEPFKYPSAYAGLISKEDQTYIEISECEAINSFFSHGGYCTAIFTRTNFVGAGDRQSIGVRNTRAATIKNNYVSVPGGIAYGGASSEMVVFEGNVAENCKCGFNFDTYHADRIKIINNQFINCNQGINFAPSGGGKDVIIDRNIFTVGKQFFNTVLGTYEEFYAIKARYCSNTTANNNYVLGPSDANFKFLDGVSGSNNTVIKTGAGSGGIDNSVAMTDLMNQNIDLKNQISNFTAQTTQLNQEKTALTNSLNTLNIELVDKTQRLYDVTLSRDVEKGRADNVTITVNKLTAAISNHYKESQGIIKTNQDLWNAIL